MADPATIKKIQDLLARAGHPETPPEEARSCGVIAARLMQQHGITIESQTHDQRTFKVSPGMGMMFVGTMLHTFLEMTMRGRAGRRPQERTVEDLISEWLKTTQAPRPRKPRKDPRLKRPNKKEATLLRRLPLSRFDVAALIEKQAQTSRTLASIVNREWAAWNLNDLLILTGDGRQALERMNEPRNPA